MWGGANLKIGTDENMNGILRVSDSDQTSIKRSSNMILNENLPYQNIIL